MEKNTNCAIHSLIGCRYRFRGLMCRFAADKYADIQPTIPHYLAE